MRQRIGLITLGVRDKDRSRAFYEALGWRGVGGGGDDPVLFQAGDMVIPSGTGSVWRRIPVSRTLAAG